MKPLPLPIRVAAGLVATAAEKARELPRTVTGLPVTVISQALQLSMRIQQHLTELAIRGDNALSALRPVEETPEWATFDEDAVDSYTGSPPASMNGLSAWDSADLEPAGAYYGEEDVEGPEDDPWQREQRALAAEHADFDTADLDTAEFDTADPHTSNADTHTSNTDTDEPDTPRPESVPDYPELSIAQLRGRLRTFDLDTLRELLEYERSHDNREEFTAMLSRRIDTVRAKR